MSSAALDPKTCSRCKATITAADPQCPERLSSKVYDPPTPRPLTPGGVRDDGSVAVPREILGEIEADYARSGNVGALLCERCVDALLEWLYTSPSGTSAVLSTDLTGGPLTGIDRYVIRGESWGVSALT